MTPWLSTLPPLVSLLIVVGIVNVVALGLTFGVRRWCHRRNISIGPPVANPWAVSIGGLSALLFAFTIVTLWNMLTDARSNATDEGAAIRVLARDLEPAQIPLLRSYVTESAAEWPQLCGGKPDSRVDDSLSALERLARPRLPEYASEFDRQLDRVEDFRYQRWRRATASIPAELRISLCIVVLALLGVLAIALPERADTHAALTVLVATGFGAVFWVITALAYPYCGNWKLGPDQIVAALRGF
jgi:hypothetical protein